MTDLEIAESIEMVDIAKIASKLSLSEEDLILYGRNKAKVKVASGKKNGKLILVTAMNPTPYGEGKTTVSIGLADALSLQGRNVCLSLRQPSLGPVFGLKGGATGGGHSQVVPMCDINLHFTGDFHAITAANNLISAAIYNHISQGNELQFDQINFHRCLDVNDRSLRDITISCNKNNYHDFFEITSASELMALFCLSSDINDLKERLSNIIVGYTKDQKMITVHDLKLEGALTVLLKDAVLPNLVQTLEHTPAFVHGGPFANIAHGCSSVMSLKLALSLSDYVVTEAGFGADLGAEKFLNIVCPMHDIHPNCIVLVVTIRALMYHGNGILEHGLCNLQAHLDHLSCYHVPVVVCINRFLDDLDADIEEVKKYCADNHVKVCTSNAYANGGKGALGFVNTVIDALNQESNFLPLVSLDMNICKKLEVLATKVYHASAIEYSEQAKEKLDLLEKLGLSYLPVCVAKTQYSISDDSKKLGYPKDYVLHVHDLKCYAGAGFITVLLGNIMSMPGLPKHPNYEKIDLIHEKVIGIF